MKILVYFPRKKLDVFFEGAMLENKIKKACKNATVVTEFDRDVDIANFINLRKKTVKVINQAIKYSIPTLLWLFYANNDENARVIETKKDGTQFIPPSRLDIINMMDGVVVPTNEAKGLLRFLGVKIPVFVIFGAVSVNKFDIIKTNESDIFRRYFRMEETQKYALSVLNIKAKNALDELNLLAEAVPHYEFFAFVSSSNSLVDRIRLRALNQATAKNLKVLRLIPEDVYRAGLGHANYFINLNHEKMSIISLYEPMYAKVPIIMQKAAVFHEILDKSSAFIVNDYTGAAYVIRNAVDASDRCATAFSYTSKVTETVFTDAICNLFKRIHTR